MANYVCVSGSSRKGNSEKLMMAAVDELKKSDNANVLEVYLSDFDPETCDGCLLCDDKGSCHINDGMNEINEQLANADGLIFGTPARWALLSGNLKTFIDRTNPLAAPEKLANKKVVVFAVGQSEGEEAESIKKAADSVVNFCSDAGMELIDTLIVEGVLNPSDIDSKESEFDKVRQLANKLVNSLS
jgi:multimeric flavodoxin WrbA